MGNFEHENLLQQAEQLIGLKMGEQDLPRHIARCLGPLAVIPGARDEHGHPITAQSILVAEQMRINQQRAATKNQEQTAAQ